MTLRCKSHCCHTVSLSQPETHGPNYLFLFPLVLAFPVCLSVCLSQITSHFRNSFVLHLHTNVDQLMVYLLNLHVWTPYYCEYVMFSSLSVVLDCAQFDSVLSSVQGTNGSNTKQMLISFSVFRSFHLSQ